jgi:hypothetical protein
MILPTNKNVKAPNKAGHILIQNMLAPKKFVIHANTLSIGGISM